MIHDSYITSSLIELSKCIDPFNTISYSEVSLLLVFFFFFFRTHESQEIHLCGPRHPRIFLWRVHLKAKFKIQKLIYRKQSHKNYKNFSPNSCSPWVGRSLGSNDTSQLVKSVLLPNTAVWRQHYPIFPRGLKIRSKTNWITTQSWDKLEWGVRREGDLKQKQQETLASTAVGTPNKKLPALHVSSLFLSFYNGRKGKGYDCCWAPGL